MNEVNFNVDVSRRQDDKSMAYCRIDLYFFHKKIR